ncbi:NAD(P)/FAD-dependent oxidoreductase [Halococcus sediminicola]|uniref:NAD(P)/FAD-dependent oxidoreductase n=1 Tax=Halococcus sediminicola TaxID=1264579 RepID=UPI00067957BA|nr:NAD(P)/FAD-dependent oxidoreductase [Halococcus sediminicola]
MDDSADYDVAVIGGGPAGLTAALYTTRLGHDTVVLNRGGGRAAMMRDTHNVIGVTENVSGNEFLQTAIEQLEGYGTDYRQTFVTDAERVDDERAFRLETNDSELFADRVVLATGFSDTHPDPPLPRTGRGLHYCLHCDAYMFVDESVYVMGHGESAAHVAMIMLNFTDDVDLLLRGHDPEWSDETDRQLRAHPVDIVESEIDSKFSDEEDSSWLGGFEFESGERREYKGGFAMYGSEYNNGLARGLGCEVNDDGTVNVDDHGNTSAAGVYAVGDLVPGHNQIPVAMGQGAKAGIDIHYDLRRFPMSLDELEAAGEITADDVPAVSDELRERSASRAAGDD